MTTAGIIEYLIKNIESIKFPLTHVEGEMGFHIVNKLYLDKYNRLYVDYTTLYNINIKTWIKELNDFFISNIYKKALNQTLNDIWND